MIKTSNTGNGFVTKISGHDICVDTTKEKGGSGNYIRPHELLEAALASCINISLQKEVNKIGVKDADIAVEVNLRKEDDSSVFEYKYAVQAENMTDEIKQRLDEIVNSSPVRKTLTKNIKFQNVD